MSGLGVVKAATAFCPDAADLPIAGECYTASSAQMHLRAFGPVNWNDMSMQAGYRCNFVNDIAGSNYFEARIHCLDVIP